MISRFGRFLIFGCGVSVGLAGGLGGCGQTTGAQNERPQMDLVRRIATSLRLSRAFDHSVLALRDGNEAKLQAASSELAALPDDSTASKSAKLKVAEVWVQQASGVTIQSNDRQNTEMLKRAETLYRRALQVSPRFESQKPDLLNAAGYFLADHGTSTTDFQEAERLTRRSLKIMTDPDWSPLADWQILLFPRLAVAARIETIANVRDSLAWALLRQHRLSEAAVEQEAVLKTYIQLGAANAVPADLSFHLGEIYRAQGRTAMARQQYEAALRVEPKHQASRAALETLKSAPPIAVPSAR